jgi:colicin import membrane protein
MDDKVIKCGPGILILTTYLNRNFIMELTPSTRDRIYHAADTLYAEADRQTFPTVDAVRKFAKVNMNDASTGMKAWRRAQTTQIAPMAIQVPGALQHSITTALTALWSEAVALANENLRAAQAGWDTERAEAEALREQIANAYEAQAMELENAQALVTRLQSEIEGINANLKEAQKRADDSALDIAIARAATKQAESRSFEIERRADDLRNELNHAHSSLVSITEELAAIRLAHGNEVGNLRTQLEQTRQKAEAEVASTRSELAQARELAAALRGKLDALTEQAEPTPKTARSRRKPDGESTT